MDINLLSGDTQKEALRRQFDVLRNMGINGRAEMTFELSDNLRSIVEAGIRQRHPDYTQDEIKQAALSLVMDRNIVRQAFGGREVAA